MKNLGITELRFWVIGNKAVHTGTPNAEEKIFAPGADVDVELSEEQIVFYKKTGHFAKD